MNITGIIAEYNPFHNGHAYQLARARALTGADYIIVVMSGDYVQRGTPAILEKHLRARLALKTARTWSWNFRSVIPQPARWILPQEPCIFWTH